MKIHIRATVNALGLVRGDEDWVDADETADMMIESGFWVWLNPPTPTYEQYEMTEAVKLRANPESEVGSPPEGVLSVWGTPGPASEAMDEEESDSGE